MTEELMYGICAGCILLCMAVCLAAGLYYRRELKRFSKALQTYEQTGTLGEEDCKEEMESKLLGQLCRVLRRSSLEREKAGKEKGEIAALLSDLSHQLKTPLANILMNTEILKEEKLTKKEQEMFLERNQEQAEKIQWLMKNLVKASRLEQGILTFESRPAPLEETIAKSISGVYAQAREKKISLEAEPFASCSPVHNPKWTAEAMGNILENAVKYSPAGSRIKIQVRPLEMYVQVNIRDQGPGIPEKEYNKIFQRFYRGRTGRAGGRYRCGTLSGPADPSERERLCYGVLQSRRRKLLFPLPFKKPGILTKLSEKIPGHVRRLSEIFRII